MRGCMQLWLLLCIMGCGQCGVAVVPWAIVPQRGRTIENAVCGLKEHGEHIVGPIIIHRLGEADALYGPPGLPKSGYVNANYSRIMVRSVRNPRNDVFNVCSVATACRHFVV